MRGLLAAFLALAALGVASAVGVGFSNAAFTAQKANPNNTFQAATSFQTMRFASGSYTGIGVDNRQITGLGFQPDVVIVKGNTGQAAVMRTSTMSGDTAKPLGGAAGPVSNRIQSFDANGFTLGNNNQVNGIGTAYYWMAFKAAPGELALGTYTGNGANRSISGLGFSPEYVATLSSGGEAAVQRYAGMTSTFRFEADTGGATGITSLDADGFSLGTDNTVNRNGTAYHYVAFNEVAGRIDAGSYTGNGSDNRSIGGTGFQPQYAMVRANDTGTSRPGVHRPTALTGDSSLYFNAAANGSNLVQALESNGFQVGSDGAVNQNGVTYHYMAFKDGGS